MIEEFRKYIAVNDLISPDGKALLAVSGGIDSMVMTHLFLRCGLDFGIAHCNFNLRGTESDEDEVFVGSQAQSHSIPFYSNHFDTEGYASENGLSVQMAARELRYQWFETIRSENYYTVTSLAHNLNDNIETFIINLVRGSGLAGFSGIRPKNGTLIRPILFASRDEIKEYAEKYEVKYREDSSNADTKYVRNKIRHMIIPLLKEINPSFDRTIEETISRVTEINEVYSGHIAKIRDSIVKNTKTGYKVTISDILALTPLNTMVYELFRGFGINRSMIPELIKITRSRSGSQLVTSTHRLIKNRGEILIEYATHDDEIMLVINSAEELINCDRTGKISVISCKEGFTIPKESSTTCISYNKLKFPLTIRNWKQGDYFYPLGMNKKKKLSDFFIDNKLSIPEKEMALVLESDGKITCIIGIRTDNRFRITRSTTKCLIIDTSAG